nr:MAG TPA: hypothetical protein [Caudoviricetes sp.]
MALVIQRRYSLLHTEMCGGCLSTPGQRSELSGHW